MEGGNMKKKLFDLSVEEFTRLLLDYPEEHDFTFVADDGEKIDCKGTYSEVLDVVRLVPTLREQLESKFFDYDMQLEDIDVYNYLEYKTDKFNVKKGGLVESQMCFIYGLYLEEVNEQARLEYIRNGWEVPKKQCKDVSANTMIEADDTKQMRERCFPCREYQYQYAMAILKRELDNKEQNANVASVEPQQEQPDQPPIPTIKDSDKEKLVFGNALQKQYMSLTNGCYKWHLSKALLAYMCGRLYCGDRVKEVDNDHIKYHKGYTQLPAKEVNRLFGVKVASNRYSIKSTPRSYWKVDELFKDNGASK